MVTRIPYRSYFIAIAFEEPRTQTLSKMRTFSPKNVHIKLIAKDSSFVDSLQLNYNSSLQFTFSDAPSNKVYRLTIQVLDSLGNQTHAPKDSSFFVKPGTDCELQFTLNSTFIKINVAISAPPSIVKTTWIGFDDDLNSFQGNAPIADAMYLEIGDSTRITVAQRGDFLGFTDTLLFWGTKTIKPPYLSDTLKLTYYGPTSNAPSNIRSSIVILSPNEIQIEIKSELPDSLTLDSDGDGIIDINDQCKFNPNSLCLEDIPVDYVKNITHKGWVYYSHKDEVLPVIEFTELNQDSVYSIIATPDGHSFNMPIALELPDSLGLDNLDYIIHCTLDGIILGKYKTFSISNKPYIWLPHFSKVVGFVNVIKVQCSGGASAPGALIDFSPVSGIGEAFTKTTDAEGKTQFGWHYDATTYDLSIQYNGTWYNNVGSWVCKPGQSATVVTINCAPSECFQYDCEVNCWGHHRFKYSPTRGFYDHIITSNPCSCSPSGCIKEYVTIGGDPYAPTFYADGWSYTFHFNASFIETGWTGMNPGPSSGVPVATFQGTMAPIGCE